MKVSKLVKCQAICQAWQGLDEPPPPHDWLVRYLLKQNAERSVNELYRTARHVLDNADNGKRIMI